MKSYLLVFLGLASMSTGIGAHASVHIAANDYSATSNPNGVWSYGYSATPTLGSSFIAYAAQQTGSGTYAGITGWSPDASGSPPVVNHNGTANAISDPGSTRVTWQPGQLAGHPGADGSYSIIRWTAPASGMVDIFASFDGLDADGTTTDVHVLHNNSILFDGAVNGYQLATRPTFNQSLISVLLGDTIDFAIGFGGNNYLNDTTGVDARVSLSAVPEPLSIAVWSFVTTIGICGNWARHRWN